MIRVQYKYPTAHLAATSRVYERVFDLKNKAVEVDAASQFWDTAQLNGYQMLTDRPTR